MIWVKTLIGHNINDGTNYLAYGTALDLLPAAKITFIENMQGDAVDSGAWTVEPRNVPLTIVIKNYANREALKAQLRSWFKRGTAGNLVANFSIDGSDYQIPVRVSNLVQDPDFPMRFTVLLQGVDTAWRSVLPETDTWNPITLSSGVATKSITVGGNDDTRLIATLTCTVGPTSGYLWQQLYQLPNVPGVNLGWGPWFISVDTAALVADNTNKCQLNLVSGIDAVTTTIPYDTVTGSIPSAGMGYWGTEQIRWTGKTGTTSGNLTGVTRGIGGTTATTHADNSEIKLSIIQANCADLRVVLNGKEVPRWIYGANTSSTKVVINLWQDVGYSLTLGAAWDNTTDYPYIEFQNTVKNKAALAKMPRSGILIHGSEWALYDGINDVTRRITVVKRGLYGTSKQSHSVGDAFVYQQNVIALVYGNSTVTDPALDDPHYDDTKPLILLSSSDNTSWVWDSTTQFRDVDGTGRTAGWSVFVKRTGDVSKNYDITTDADSGNPAMGQKIGSYLKGTGYVQDVATLRHTFSRACGLNTLTVTGKKYRNGSVYPGIAAFQKSKDGTLWTIMFSEAKPASQSVWTNWATHSAVSFGSGMKWVSLIFSGTIGGSGIYAMHECLTATVTFITANLPTGTLLTKTNNFQLDLNLANNANSDAIDLLAPMLIGKPLTIDGENRLMTYDTSSAFDAVRYNDESRSIPIRLKPGTNQLQITAVDVGTSNVALSWYKRRI